MEDIGFNCGDLYIKDNDFTIMSDSEALKEQLYVFLNIRAAHKDGDGNIVFAGELQWDQEQGIDFIYIFELGTTDTQIKNHYRAKMLRYYGDFITKIEKIDVNRNVENRTITLDFEYKTIWSKKLQNFTIESEV
jgi:hypothetical protein